MTFDLLSSRSEHKPVTMTTVRTVLTPVAGERKTTKSKDTESPVAASENVPKLKSEKQTQQRRRRKVTFCPQIQYEQIILRSEIPQEEFEAAWYCHQEFRAMKKAMVPIVKKMAKGLPLDDDEESRGLEHKTPQGSKKRCANRDIALDAVLQEQDRQWEYDRSDAIALSKVYNQSSAHCLMQAYLIAKGDEEYVLNEVRGKDANKEEEDTESVSVDSESSASIDSEKENKVSKETTTDMDNVAPKQSVVTTSPLSPMLQHRRPVSAATRIACLHSPRVLSTAA